ncbi:MAG: hypothetical protein HYR71_08770 [Chloroflexi bacterium]|nr:hypothetical protein [Chloroflexota bacterium]
MAVLALLVGACDTGPAPTPSPTPPPPPTATAEATATLTLAPTATPVPPTVTPTIPPTAAPTATQARPTTPPVALTGAGLISAQVPPQMAKDKCGDFQRDGFTVTALWVERGEVDKGGGRYDWTSLDAQVNELRNCNVEVMLHVQAKMGEARVPANMDDYMRYLTEFVKHLKGRVRRYSIENEAVGSQNWPSTPESYFSMLDRAYTTIKAADPSALVENSGISSEAFGFAWAYNLYQAGQQQQALTVSQQTLAEGVAGLKTNSPTSVNSLDAFWKTALVSRGLAWWPLLLKHQASIDVFQYHYYGPWENLPLLLRWLRAQGITKPIEGWEVARRYHGQVAFDETFHAQETVKLLVSAAGEGSQVSLFMRYADWSENNLPGLLMPQGTPRPVETAFRMITQNLAGYTAASFVDLGPAAWGYRFSRPQGDVVVVWATGNPTTVKLPIQGRSVQVTDITGKTSTADPANLAVSASPIFVQ